MSKNTSIIEIASAPSVPRNDEEKTIPHNDDKFKPYYMAHTRIQTLALLDEKYQIQKGQPPAGTVPFAPKVRIGITGGGRRIRTSESLTALTLFESARFNHSRIPPLADNQQLTE